MGEHSARIEVAKAAEEVFAILANPLNLPRWQPAFRETLRESPEQLRAIRGGVGAEGTAHLRFVADPATRHLCWAAAPGRGCAGDVWVEPAAGGAAVEMRLRLGAPAERAEALAAWTGDPALDVAAALRATLAAAKALCEDRTRALPLVSGGMQDRPGEAPLADSRPYGSSATQNPGTT